jgi:hypothetical protein
MAHDMAARWRRRPWPLEHPRSRRAPATHIFGMLRRSETLAKLRLTRAANTPESPTIPENPGVPLTPKNPRPVRTPTTPKTPETPKTPTTPKTPKTPKSLKRVATPSGRARCSRPAAARTKQAGRDCGASHRGECGLPPRNGSVTVLR